MDDIISKFEKIITCGNNDIINNVNDIDTLILAIQNTTLIEANIEYERLQKNYHKLIYFKNLLNKINKINNINVINVINVPLFLFMEKIDKLNQYYIDKINLESHIHILDSLNYSLNTNIPLKKIEYIIYSYSKIIDIVESR